MIRTLLLTSIITFVGQATAFPVLHYADIQHELAKIRLDQDPLELLSLIETHVRHDWIALSPHERLLLVNQLEALKQDVENYCDRMYKRFDGLALPWFVTLGLGCWFVRKWGMAAEDITKDINASIQGTYEEYRAYMTDAHNEADVAKACFLISFAVTLLAHMQHTGQVNNALGGDYRALTNKINNIIALLKQ